MTDTIEPTTSDAGTAASAAPKKRSGGLNTMLLADLKSMAGGLGIRGAGSMKKAQLVDAIKAAQSGGAPSGGGRSASRERREPEVEGTSKTTGKAGKQAGEPRQDGGRSVQASHEQASHEQASHEQASHEQPSHEQPSHEQPSDEQKSHEEHDGRARDRDDHDSGDSEQGKQRQGRQARQDRQDRNQNAGRQDRAAASGGQEQDRQDRQQHQSGSQNTARTRTSRTSRPAESAERPGPRRWRPGCLRRRRQPAQPSTSGSRPRPRPGRHPGAGRRPAQRARHHDPRGRRPHPGGGHPRRARQLRVRPHQRLPARHRRRLRLAVDGPQVRPAPRRRDRRPGAPAP